MESIISIDTIRVGIEANEKELVLKFISKMALENGIVKSEDEYLEGLLEREREFTTGFGGGFAIPHCKSSTVNRAAVLVCKLENDVEWEAMDDKPVKFVLALAIPEAEARTTHLKVLSQIAKCLMDSEFTDSLKKANKEIEIYNLLVEKLRGGF